MQRVTVPMAKVRVRSVRPPEAKARRFAILAKDTTGILQPALFTRKLMGVRREHLTAAQRCPFGMSAPQPDCFAKERSRRTATQHGSLRKVTKPATDPFGSLIDLPCDPEPVIQSRIQAIVEYLGQIQEK